MTPESIALAERIITESDPGKVTELVEQLCRALEAKPEHVMRAGELPSFPAPK